MRIKKLMSIVLSGIMLLTSGGIIPVSAETEQEFSPNDLARCTEETMLFNIDDYYTSGGGTSILTGTEENGAGWTIPAASTLDNDTYQFLGLTAGDITMSNGYGAEQDWTAMQFTAVKNSGGDYAVYDLDGNAIYGNCYAVQYNRKGQEDGFYIGHGERSFTNSFDGTDTTHINDGTVNRFKNYLKSDIKNSVNETTGNFHYSTNANDDTITIFVENKNGTVIGLSDNVLTANTADTDKFNSEEKTYTGDYYTVNTYQNDELVTTEYYSGHRNGIKYMKHKGKNYYGGLKIYAGTVSAIPTEEPTATPTEEPAATPTVEPAATPMATPTANPTETPKTTDNNYTSYVFAYFRRPVGQRDDERLCLGVSRDGYTFRALNNGEPVFTSNAEGKQYSALRDPQIIRGEDNKFYIAVTDLLGTANPNHQIIIYPTSDLVTIEKGIVIDYSKYEGFEKTTRAWAPQIIWCNDHENADGTKGAYMIYLAICKGDPVTESTDMYKHFTTDLSDPSKYTAPERMLEGESESSIDGDITYDPIHDEYIMYYNGKSIATSKTVDGMYTKQDKTVFDAGKMVEGSNVFKLNKYGKQTEDKWIICADGGSFGTGFNMAETTDFETYTELKSSNGDFDYDFTPRHGYVVPITEKELNTLMDAYGFIDLPDRFSENPIANLTLPYTENGYKIAGNITLPESFEGNDLIWKSSDDEVINTEKKSFTADEKAKYGANYNEIPAGTVTRPKNADKKVTLTAQTTVDGKDYTKTFTVTVKKAAEKSYAQMDEDGDFKGYLYASFIEPPKDASGQQVYFASSDDGRNWNDLNDNKPVLTSTMGTGSTRDHYIVRSPEGDRFYIIATDLNCFAKNGNWTQYAENGSKYLMVWESDDLVNWSKQRMVKVADDNTGCAWAPEAIYDDLTGEYIVYWSGTDINKDSENYGKKVVYYSKTRDFYSFTPQQQYVIPQDTDGVADGTSRSFIDTTMIKGSDNKFYRVTKYEETSPTRVFMDVADYPLGTFTRANTNLTDNALLGTEGPGWFKYNKDDAEKYGAKYCLMLDGYNGPNKGVGFFPTSIEDLNGQSEFTFTKLTSGFKMRTNGSLRGLFLRSYNRLKLFIIINNVS